MSLAQTCPKCGAEGRYKGFHKRHVLACERLPSGAGHGQMTCPVFGKKYFPILLPENQTT